MAVMLKQIARQAGVSISTASSILNGLNRPYRDETRKKVVHVAQSLGYRPDAVTRRIRRGCLRRDAIGVLLRHESVSRLANSLVYEFICGINDILLERNQFMMMVQLAQLHEQSDGAQPRLIGERFVDGVIIENDLPPWLYEAVVHYRIPAVFLNGDRHEKVDCIWPDEVHAGELATRHLIELGHRRIVFVVPHVWRLPRGEVSLPHFSLHDRPRGYEQAMRAAGLTPEVFCPANPSDENHDELIRMVLASRAEGRPITGLVTSGPLVRLPQLLALAGITCPREISIIAANNSYETSREAPSLVRVSCDRYRMGRWAGEMILAKVDSDGQPQPSRMYCGEIIAGQTAAPSPAGAAST